MNQRVIVLDLGASKAAAVAAELSDDGSLHVLGYSTTMCKGIRKGAVVDLDETVESISEVVRDLQNELVQQIDTVCVSIGGPMVEVLQVQGLHPIYPRTRPITRDDVMQVINHSRRHVLEPDREEIQAIPKEFSIDGQRGITRPIGMSGGRLEVTTMLVTSHATQIQNIERAASGAGIRISHFVQRGLASGLGVLSEGQIESGAAVVDIGAGGTEVAVFSKGSMCFAAAIPVGGLLVTSDIGKLLKTSPEEAERLKLKAGKALAGSVTESESVGVLQLGQIHERPLQRRVLCEIIESRMREVATMVRQQLERSGHYGMLPGGVVLTGGGAQLLGVDDLFADVLQHHKVSIATPHVGGKSAPAVDSADMSTAIGMAKFVLTSESEELSTVGGDESLAGRIKTIWSLLSGKP